MGRTIDAISRRAVLDRLETLRRNYGLKAGYRDAMTDAIGEVHDALTIDAVPVVRCKDCKYAHSENGIWYWCSTDKRKRPSSFYCSAGRKKDEYDD